MKRLYRNEPLHIDEWRVLSAPGRVVVDEELSDDTIALDQTLRNALGMRMNLIQSVRVKLCRAEGTLARRIRSRFDNGQYLFLRVNYPALNDMEKKSCRISSDALKLLRSKDGHSIWVENCVSQYRRELAGVLDVPASRYPDCNEGILDKWFCDMVLPEELYPDSTVIFNMKPDIETIRSDKYYRDKLSLNTLDSVRVKRRWPELFLGEIINYGLIFVLTVLAVMIAITPENIILVKYDLPLSIVFSFGVTWLKTK